MKNLILPFLLILCNSAFSQTNNPKTTGYYIVDNKEFNSPFLVVKEYKDASFKYNGLYEIKSDLSLYIGEGSSNTVVITSDSKDIAFMFNVNEIEYDNKKTITKLKCNPMGNKAETFHVTHYHLEGRICVTSYLRDYELVFYYYDSAGIGIK